MSNSSINSTNFANSGYSNVPSSSTQALLNSYNIPSTSSALNTIRNLTSSNSQFNLSSAREANAFSQLSADKAMAFSSNQAAINRDFQERMSSTSYQRQVKDLKAAGLNPVLAAMSGGSSTPSGSTASSAQAQGHQASADTSGSGGISSILGSMLSYMSNQAVADTNARTNLAVADKYNAVSQFLGELTNLTNLKTATISADAHKYASNQSAAAQRYSSDRAYNQALDTTNAKHRNDIAYSTQFPSNIYQTGGSAVQILKGIVDDLYDTGLERQRNHATNGAKYEGTGNAK